jgi:hypothetical protein
MQKIYDGRPHEVIGINYALIRAAWYTKKQFYISVRFIKRPDKRRAHENFLALK